MAPSPMLQARLKELERGRAAATTPKSADLEDTILGPLGRRLDAEEKGEGPPSTVELFRVEAPDAPGTVGPAAHEFTTFDDYAGQPPPPPPPDDGVRAAFASPSPAADAKFYADDSDDDEALLAMHTAYQAAARRRPGARDQVWAASDAVANPADVLNAALVSGQPESPPAVPTPAGIAASTRPSPVAAAGGSDWRFFDVFGNQGHMYDYFRFEAKSLSVITQSTQNGTRVFSYKDEERILDELPSVLDAAFPCPFPVRGKRAPSGLAYHHFTGSRKPWRPFTPSNAKYRAWYAAASRRGADLGILEGLFPSVPRDVLRDAATRAL